MAKRFMAVWAVAALTLGVAAFSAGGASAAAPPVNASGVLHCGMKGTIKLVPPLVNGGTATSATMSGKLSSVSCTGGSHVTAISGLFSITLPSNNCASLGGGLPAGTFGPAKLKGAAKYNPTTIHFTAGGHVTVADPPTLDEPGAGTSSASNSFAGQHPTMHIVFDTTLATLGANCTPKTKGVKGSGGLKKIKLKTGSTLDIT